MFGCATTVQDVQKWESQGDIGIPKLIDALESPKSSPLVRQAAAEALVKIGDSKAVEALSAALKDEDADVRQAAAAALGKIGDPKAVDALSTALKDGDADVRRVAVEALSKIGDPKVVDALSAALKDEDSYVRRISEQALLKIGTPEALSAVSKAMAEERDLLDLLDSEKIEVKTQGSGISNVNLQVRRLVNFSIQSITQFTLQRSHKITVRIPVGTYFVSHRASAQDMVATAEETVVLSGDEWVSVSVSVACANRSRDIPGREDSFDIRWSPEQKVWRRLMPVLLKANAGFSVLQAAVWIVTDNATYGDLGILTRSIGGFALGGRIINEYEAALAMKICDEAGIDITRKAIWKDRDDIIQGLQDENLKKWLQQRAQNDAGKNKRHYPKGDLERSG